MELHLLPYQIKELKFAIRDEKRNPKAYVDAKVFIDILRNRRKF